MPRYFFHIRDGEAGRDDIGTECADLDEMRRQAIRILPDLARENIPKDGDRRFFTMLVTDEAGQSVYSATLNFTGMWLTR